MAINIFSFKIYLNSGEKSQYLDFYIYFWINQISFLKNYLDAAVALVVSKH